MRASRSLVLCAGLVSAASSPLPVTAGPLAYLAVGGSVQANAADGANGSGQQTQMDEYHAPNVPVPGGNTGAAAAAASGNAVVGSQNHPQAATATVTDTAAYGVLKGGAMAATQTDRYESNTSAQASSTTLWFDTFTFHTSRVGGVDFAYLIGLDDQLSTTILPFADPGPTGGSTRAVAQTQLLVSRGNDALDQLAIQDDVQQFAPGPGNPAGSTVSHVSPNRTQSGVVHVLDGDVLTFEQLLYEIADVDSIAASASVSTDLSAYFELRSLDPDGTYTTVSGTLYPSVGEPGSPPPSATVPEPSGVALVFAGFAGLMGFGRRVAKRKARDT